MLKQNLQSFIGANAQATNVTEIHLAKIGMWLMD